MKTKVKTYRFDEKGEYCEVDFEVELQKRTPTIEELNERVYNLENKISLFERGFEQDKKQELFEMRFSFYLELSEKRTKSYNDNKDMDSNELVVLSRKAKFLFDKDISDYILSLNAIRRQNPSYNAENEFSNKFNKYLKLK